MTTISSALDVFRFTPAENATLASYKNASKLIPAAPNAWKLFGAVSLAGTAIACYQIYKLYEITGSSLANSAPIQSMGWHTVVLAGSTTTAVLAFMVMCPPLITTCIKQPDFNSFDYHKYVIMNELVSLFNQPSVQPHEIKTLVDKLNQTLNPGTPYLEFIPQGSPIDVEGANAPQTTSLPTIKLSCQEGSIIGSMLQNVGLDKIFEANKLWLLLFPEE